MSQSTEKQQQILDAALQVFGRYGFRRTSMELIAQAAGVSRPALYKHYAGKEEIFRAVAEGAIDRLVGQAAEIGKEGGDVADRVFRALNLKLEFVTGSVEAGFRGEMLAEVSVLAPDLTRSFKDRHAAVIKSVLLAAGDDLPQLGTVLSADDAAELLLAALTGISQQEDEAHVLRTRLRQLVDITVRSLT
ncbi:AcrR family transcriptional regulator [Nonomuraea thailandensis]|uniref:AcrR family transcriptional regulator n=1 Tax=Nonomuraea thailandensis TaxID=1188745 RepID=A0A9X2K5F7_9ACTN|nr:TetR/AcrR family transcriptional regulator [Nonomuraea thailandensis]MCP2360340.1 AcrR family transcriptional regulator [Nonomuraea thailandensis]